MHFCSGRKGRSGPNPTANLVGEMRGVDRLRNSWRILGLVLVATCWFSVAGAAAFRSGDQGDEVAQIQKALAGLGYEVGVDGEFGPATKAAVMAFQESKGLEADGLVGDTTYRALIGRDMPEVSRGSTAAVRRVMQTSMRYIGVPYVFGGTTPGGFDCSGYTRYVFANAGIALPRMADEQYWVGSSVSYGNLQVGDLVFFTTYAPGVSHVGIYMGNGTFIHASSSRGVVVDNIGSSYWSTRYVGAKRVI